MKGSYIAIIICICMSIYTGYALECYSCDGFCTSVSVTNCSEMETCFSIEKQLGESLAKTKGCLDEKRCNTTVGEAVRHCCNTELCNSGTVPGVFFALFCILVFLSSSGLFSLSSLK